MPKNIVINERASSAALRLLGGYRLLEMVRLTYDALDNAERAGFEDGFCTANVMNANDERVRTEDYSNGYADGVQDARVRPEFADAVLRNQDVGVSVEYPLDEAVLADREEEVSIQQAAEALESSWGRFWSARPPRTPKSGGTGSASDNVNTFENYGLTEAELEASHRAEDATYERDHTDPDTKSADELTPF